MKYARAVSIVGSLFALLKNRLGVGVATPLGEQELSCVRAPDRRLVVLGHEPIAGYELDLGAVADEAAMLALHTMDSATLIAEPVFIAPGDSCTRTDDPGWRWHCISGHGLALEDWERRPLAGALEEFAAAEHTHTIADVADLPEVLAGKQATLSISTVGTNLLAVVAPETEKNIRVNPNGTISLADPGSGSSGLEVSSGPEPVTSVDLSWSSGGTESGAISYLASLGGAWANPVTSLQVVVVATYGTPSDFVDRSNNTVYGYGVGSFVGVDVGAGRSVLPNAYTLRNYTSPDRFIRSWVFEGTNAVAGNTVAQWDAATWDALDVRPYDETMVSIAPTSYTCTQPAVGYRYFRWRLTGNDSYGAPYMCVSECDVYGTLNGSFGVTLPDWATGWLTDGTHYIPGVW